MKTISTPRTAGLAMAGVAGLAIAGFTALGSLFDYPKILKAPAADVLERFRDHQGPVMAWFGVLVVSAALLAPVGVLLGRIASGRLGGWIRGLGIAAAIVQVIGLSRWFLFVPAISDDAVKPEHTAAAHHTFRLLRTWLGTALGETLGYSLTAAFTVLVVIAVTRRIAPRWMTYLGYAAGVLIATGTLIPLGLSSASVSNFIGYVGWCLWLIAIAVTLWRVHPDPATRDERPAQLASVDSVSV